MGRDIFISYSQPDRECAFELTQHLEAQGLTVWIAPRDISPAAEWAEEIIDAIAAARVMVLVFSARSNDSQQVRREVERAVHKNLRILPFRIENVLPSRSLEYFLSSQHWLDGFPAPRTAHYERLCGYLRQWLPGTSASPVRPAAAPATPLAEPPSGRERFAPDVLRQLEARLARLVGPIARVLVEREAAVAADLADLERRIAAEIDSPEDRRRYASMP